MDGMIYIWEFCSHDTDPLSVGLSFWSYRVPPSSDNEYASEVFIEKKVIKGVALLITSFLVSNAGVTSYCSLKIACELYFHGNVQLILMPLMVVR